MAESDQLVEVLKEIRDELRAVRTELGGRAPRGTNSGIRTQRVALERRWRITALAAGGVAALALLLGLVMRDRPASTPVAVAPQFSTTPAVSSAAPVPPTMGTIGTPGALPAQATAVPPAPVAARATVPVAKESPPALATKQAARVSAPVASVPAPAKKRVQPEVAAKPPAEVASDEDETLAFPPPPRRVRVHRLSYGPVGAEPAKL